LGATTRFGLRFPELTDAPNGPAQLQTLAGDADTWLSRVYRCTSSTRPTGVPDDFLIRESDTGNMYVWTGSAWSQIAPVVSGGGGGGSVLGTVSATYTATSSQPIPNNTDTTVAFGVDAVTTSEVTRSTSGAGHKFTLNQTRLWAVTATVRFTENGVGGRAVDIRTGSSTLLAKAGSQSSATNPYTVSLSCVRRLTSGTQISVVAWQNSGGSLALDSNSGNTVHIDIAGI
jgi:hypothetical protein